MRAEPHVAEAEAAAHDEAVAEELLDLLRVGVGADVEVLGLALEQEVAYTASHQVGHEAVVLQAVEDLEGILVDVLAGDVVLGPGQDAGGDVPGGVLHARIIPAAPGPRGGATTRPPSRDGPEPPALGKEAREAELGQRPFGITDVGIAVRRRAPMNSSSRHLSSGIEKPVRAGAPDVGEGRPGQGPSRPLPPGHLARHVLEQADLLRA